MVANITPVTSVEVVVEGTELGIFTHEVPDWNGLRCMCNSAGEKIIIQAVDPLLAFLPGFNTEYEATIISMTPGLRALVTK